MGVGTLVKVPASEFGVIAQPGEQELYIGKVTKSTVTHVQVRRILHPTSRIPHPASHIPPHATSG